MSQSRMVELISEIDLTGDVEVSQDNLIWWPARYAATCESHKRPYICRRTDVKREVLCQYAHIRAKDCFYVMLDDKKYRLVEVK